MSELGDLWTCCRFAWNAAECFMALLQSCRAAEFGSGLLLGRRSFAGGRAGPASGELPPAFERDDRPGRWASCASVTAGS